MRILAITLTLCFWAQGAIAEKRAFILGNAAYEELEPLRNTLADAQAYKTAFEDLGYRVSYQEDLNFEETLDAFETFVSLVQPGDQVVFVYSGHGWSDGEVNYLIPTDAPKEGSTRRLARASLALKNGLNGVLDDLQATGAGLTVAVIDACRNNPFSAKPGTRSTNLSRGLAPVRTPQGTFVIFSAGEGQAALDRLPDDPEDQRLSVFTRTFLPHLTSGAYLEDAISNAQVETAALAAGADGHLQHPAYYDQTLGFTCLTGQCDRAGAPRQKTPTQTLQAALNAGSATRCDRLYQAAAEQAACFAWEVYAETCQGHDFQPIAQRFIADNCTASSQTADAAQIAACDAAALHPDHPVIAEGKVQTSGVAYRDIDADAAVAACLPAVLSDPDNARMRYNLARAYEKQDSDTKANENYELASDLGDVAAQYEFGLNLVYGYTGIKDVKRAVIHFERAVLQGNTKAALELGYLYDESVGGLTRNLQEALRLYTIAANAGNAQAMHNIALMHDGGKGLPENDAEAALWYQKAVDAGHGGAAVNLGLMYKNGQGVAKDLARAAQLFELGVARDISHAAANLGLLYELGQGVSKDPVKAAELYLISLQGGNEWLMGFSASQWDRQTAREMQTLLKNLGHYTGKIDGVMGAGAKRAMQAVLDAAKQ